MEVLFPNSNRHQLKDINSVLHGILEGSKTIQNRILDAFGKILRKEVAEPSDELYERLFNVADKVETSKILLKIFRGKPDVTVQIYDVLYRDMEGSDTVQEQILIGYESILTGDILRPNAAIWIKLQEAVDKMIKRVHANLKDGHIKSSEMNNIIIRAAKLSLQPRYRLMRQDLHDAAVRVAVAKLTECFSCNRKLAKEISRFIYGKEKPSPEVIQKVIESIGKVGLKEIPYPGVIYERLIDGLGKIISLKDVNIQAYILELRTRVSKACPAPFIKRKLDDACALIPRQSIDQLRKILKKIDGPTLNGLPDLTRDRSKEELFILKEIEKRYVARLVQEYLDLSTFSTTDAGRAELSASVIRYLQKGSRARPESGFLSSQFEIDLYRNAERFRIEGANGILLPPCHDQGNGYKDWEKAFFGHLSTMSQSLKLSEQEYYLFQEILSQSAPAHLAKCVAKKLMQKDILNEQLQYAPWPQEIIIRCNDPQCIEVVYKSLVKVEHFGSAPFGEITTEATYRLKKDEKGLLQLTFAGLGGIRYSKASKEKQPFKETNRKLFSIPEEPDVMHMLENEEEEKRDSGKSLSSAEAARSQVAIDS